MTLKICLPCKLNSSFAYVGSYLYKAFWVVDRVKSAALTSHGLFTSRVLLLPAFPLVILEIHLPTSAALSVWTQARSVTTSTAPVPLVGWVVIIIYTCCTGLCTIYCQTELRIALIFTHNMCGISRNNISVSPITIFIIIYYNFLYF